MNDTYELTTVPGYSSRRPGIQIATQMPENASADDMRLIRQLGIEWVMTSADGDGRQNAGVYRRIRERFEENGLKVYRLANHSCHNMEAVTLALPEREAKIEEYLRYIRDLGEAGIRYSTYAHMANGIWSSGSRPIRGGAEGRSLDMEAAKGSWKSVSYGGVLTHGRAYSEEELWDNFSYFMERVVPVAEEAGVRIGIHPDDPPVYGLGGIPRCIFGTFDGYRRALEIAHSPNIGVCLCVGCWLEGGVGMGADVTEAIGHFGGAGKLFKVHFRNITAPLPEGFTETFLDNGYMNMYRVMKALQETGFDGAVISDHLPKTAGGRTAAEAHALGYMKGLLQAAETEAGIPYTP